jgi:hypothetical protein
MMNWPLSQQEAATELIRRRNVRRSLVEWCRHCSFEPALHHRLLIDRLEKLAQGKLSQLAVFMPPGSAKSTYASILFPPWFMAGGPQTVLAASHTTELAEKWGRRVRNLIAEHSATLGVRLSDDSHAAGRWALSQGGEYYAAGVGVGIAGFRADLIVIDDRSARARTPIRRRCGRKSGTGIRPTCLLVSSQAGASRSFRRAGTRTISRAAF